MNVRDMMAGWYIYTDKIPQLLLALLVLAVGWLIAKWLGNIVEAGLKKTSLDNKLFSSLGNRTYTSERIIGKIVYYTLLVIVWIIFFNMLHLSFIAEPLVRMVSMMTAAIPHLLKAALILLFAWVAAMALRFLFKKAATFVRLQYRLVKWKMAPGEQEAYRKVDGLAQAIYYLVLLLFLPAVLSALEMEGVSEPFSHVLATMLAFIPKLFAAALIVFVGWIIAKIVRDIVTNFLKSIGIDRLGERFGLMKNGEEATSLAAVIGHIVFILIMIPTIITALEKLALTGISAPAIAMLDKIVTLIPNIVVAVLLLLVGIWLGKWVEKLVSQMLWRLRFDSVLHQIGLGTLTPEPSKTSLSQLVGILAKIVVVLLFTVEALQIVHLNFVVTLATGVIAYLPMLFAAILILGVGFYVGHLVERLVKSLVKHSQARTLAGIAKYTIVVITVFMALDQLGVAHSIVNAAFILILGGLALAFGLAFGLGGKAFASKYLEKLDDKIDEGKPHS
ncbi:mechanosensitive ion channel [Neobacillus jeddahensis]|uniref:mechanosensitive ion channel n=1 Tax=Neobacillus jeddahensis TaxID=1461580 RepID=UPI00058D003C|nr:mechanosensitive ion channel [Neobacillus jeddahensis]